jgi:hypothetical protein
LNDGQSLFKIFSWVSVTLIIPVSGRYLLNVYSHRISKTKRKVLRAIISKCRKEGRAEMGGREGRRAYRQEGRQIGRKEKGNEGGLERREVEKEEKEVTIFCPLASV